jgi:hypothetical protein
MATPTMSKTAKTNAARSNTATASGADWGRRRLLGILATAVVVAALLFGGLVYALVLAVGGVGSQASPVGGAATGIADSTGAREVPRGGAHRDRIAAAAMLAVPDDAMFPGEVAGTAHEGIEIPGGQAPGPAQILTGFPHTPAGALGQLAQIDLAVLEAMSLSTAQEVYRAWALPGGIGPDRWRVAESVRAFLTSTSMGEVLDPGAAVEVEPAAGLVKGTDGPDWLVVCVLLKVTASYRQQGQVAFAHCERMQWVGGRWMIAPGLPPTPAPATWPGTALANQAGWRPWITDH